MSYRYPYFCEEISAGHYRYFTTNQTALDSWFEKGFKIVLHKDEGTDKVIEKMQKPVFEKRIREPRAYKESAKEPETDSGEIDEIYKKVGLPKAPKFREKMSGFQKRLFDYLILNDGKKFTMEKLALMLDSSYDSVRVNGKLPEMVEKGLVVKSKTDNGDYAYGTEMAAKVA